MHRTTKLTAGTLGALLLAGAAACGGSSGGSGTPAGQGSTETKAGPAQHPAQLVGTVGKNDAYTIALSDGNGKAITNLAAGSYKLTVHDYSGIHNFHLSGSGVNDATQVGEETTKTFQVTFKPGTYTFQCDPHASSMHGSFTVS